MLAHDLLEYELEHCIEYTPKGLRIIDFAIDSNGVNDRVNIHF